VTEPTTPGVPVPPDELRARWFMDCASGENFNTKRHANLAAAWGHAQALQERAELRELLIELAKYLETPDIESGIIPSKNRKLADRARAAAERLTTSAQEKNDG
jgi:hypothetical protein